MHIGKCKVKNCKTKEIIAFGFCDKHYRRYKKYGDPYFLKKLTTEQIDEAFNLAFKHTSKDCLFWPYGVNNHGYGMKAPLCEGGTKLVHRQICEKINGPPPSENHEAAHSCGNGHLGCYNLKHLRWATKSENSIDSIKHGTHNKGKKLGPNLKLRKENHYNVKMTEEKVLRVRKLKRKGFTGRDIAKKFKVSEALISKILNKKSAWDRSL